MKVLKLKVILLLGTLIAAMLFVSTSSAQTPMDWTELISTGQSGSPPERRQHSLVWDEQSNRMLLFGGCCTFNDLWSYSTNDGWVNLTAQSDPSSPIGRWLHAMVWDSTNNRLLVFGGFAGDPSNDLWEYTDSGGWSELTPKNAAGSPRSRFGHSMVWDKESQRLLVYGGATYDAFGTIVNNYDSDLWEYTDSGGWQQLILSGDPMSPVGRRYHSVVWDEQNNRMLLFGGERFGINYNDLWEYTAVDSWLNLIPDQSIGSPPQRSWAGAVWDNQNNRFLVTAGCDSFTPCSDYYNDLWAYTNGGWSPITQGVGQSFGRAQAAAVWDRQENRLLLFGGISPPDGLSDNALWQYKPSPPQPVITTSSLSFATVGTSYSQTVQAMSGTTPYSWSVSSGSLPSGFSLNSSTGEISGNSSSSGTFNFIVEVTDANFQTDTQALSILVNVVPNITTTTLPDATITGVYSLDLQVSGGSTPFAWSINTGSLPSGMSLSSGGVLSGTPTVTGTYSFTVQVTDTYGVTDTQSLDLFVSPAPTIDRNNLPDRKVGQSYSQTVTASGGTAPLNWSVSSGSLPPGLSLNPLNGQISGTPITVGTYSFTILVVDANNVSVSKSFTIEIKP